MDLVSPCNCATGKNKCWDCPPMSIDSRNRLGTEVKAIIDDYSQGVNTRLISAKYNIHLRSITRIVKRYNIPLRVDVRGKPFDNRGGRPSQELKHVVTARLDKDTKIALAGYAAKKGRPIADCLRDFIEWGLENDK